MDALVSLVVSGGLIVAIVWWFFARNASSGVSSKEGAMQTATIVVKGGYSPEVLELSAQLPTQLQFDRKDSSSCLEEIIIPHAGIQKKLKMGQGNTVQLDAMDPGEYDYSCGMRMYHGKLVVK